MEHASRSSPIAIAKVAGRYLVFDINVVSHLRRNHHIIGVNTGCIPLAPQQNLFNGLPVEFLPEEARVLVGKGVAYIIDDTSFHKQHFSLLAGADRRLYLQSLKAQGRKAQQGVQVKSAASTGRHLARQASLRAASDPSFTSSPAGSRIVSDSTITSDEDSLFNDRRRPASPASSISSVTSSGMLKPLAVTPSATYPLLSEAPSSQDLPLPDVPTSFPFFAHLHEKGYYMSPGLRFGCQYSVYPGDPLRFHAHFLGTGYEWDEEIPLLDVVGGGRLGTGVKKGFLLGAEDQSKEVKEVRTFCVEWGGM